MNKKLLIVAVGAALVAGPMLAAQAAAPTLYGHFHMSSDNIDNNNAKYGYISSNSTRIGVKGDEDLGGGLKAIYQVEGGILAVDTGVAGMGNTLRNSYLGLAGSSWGAVKVGRYDSPFKELGRKLDNFNEELGDMRNVLSGSTSAASAYDNRLNNMIRYESPNMSGLTVNVAHSSNDASSLTAEGPGGSGKSNNNLGVNWSSGPIFVGAAYQKLGYNKGGTVTKDHDNSWRLAGAYTMDNLMVGLIYQDLKDIAGKDLNQKAMGLAASFKMANNMIKFHYLTLDDLKGSTAAGANSDTGSKLWALGVDHMFSKTTKVYVDYAQAKNDNNTAGTSVISGNGGHGETLLTSSGVSGTNPGFGKKVKGISAGMVLNF